MKSVSKTVSFSNPATPMEQIGTSHLCYLGVCALSVICAFGSNSRRQSSYFLI